MDRRGWSRIDSKNHAMDHIHHRSRAVRCHLHHYDLHKSLHEQCHGRISCELLGVVRGRLSSADARGATALTYRKGRRGHHSNQLQMQSGYAA